MKIREFLETGKTLDYSESSSDPLLLDQELIRDVQQLLVNAGYHTVVKGFSVDGLFGRLSRQALNSFKEDITLSEPDQLNSITVEKLLELSTKEFEYMYPPVRYGRRGFISTIPMGAEQKALSAADYETAAQEYGLEVAAVRAVVEIESAGSGFLIREPAPARPKILFEAHIFYAETPKPVSQTRPDLSSKSWNKALYKGGSGEWERLFDAMTFDPIPALRSASWGLGQIMGFNHERLGCETVEQLVIEAHQGELPQLRHMLNFCKTEPKNRLIPALQSKDWVTFARIYNGPGYRENKYDEKLAASYARWKQQLG